MKFIFVCLFIFLLPSLTHAAVTINEVAWMGDSQSANNEWIELYNSGSQSVDVTGWRLSDGMNLDVELTGAVGAGQFAVLERTDDASAVGTAFLIYSGSLVNSGATLSLYRVDDSLEDRIVGGEAWVNIGGDNVTKETAQYTTQGWVTAVATPGESNEKYNPVYDDSSNHEEAANENNDNLDTDKKESPMVSSLYFIPRELKLDVAIPSRVYVNQEVPMSVTPAGVSDGILQSLEHSWNFGDFTTAKGKEVKQRFAFPGEYVVTLHSKYKEYEAYARKTVTVLPVSFSITKNPQGDVQVHNNARYEVNVSGYKIVAGKTLTFPEGTILLPNATITIPKEKLKNTSGVTLFDDTGASVALVLGSSGVQPTVAPPKTPTAATAPLLSAPAKEVTQREASDSFTFVNTTSQDNEPTVQQTEETSIETPQIEATTRPAREIPSEKLPYFALLAVIGIGVTTVFIGRKNR